MKVMVAVEMAEKRYKIFFKNLWRFQRRGNINGTRGNLGGRHGRSSQCQIQVALKWRKWLQRLLRSEITSGSKRNLGQENWSSSNLILLLQEEIWRSKASIDTCRHKHIIVFVKPSHISYSLYTDALSMSYFSS